jgi:hypothetical protein
VSIEAVNSAIAQAYYNNQLWLDRLETITEKDVINRLNQSLDNVRRDLAEMYANMGADVTFAEMNKFNRLANLEASIAEELRIAGVDVKTNIGKGANETFAEAYYGSGYALENGIGAKLGFTEIPKDAITAALINPYDKIGWKGRAAGHIAALTVNVQNAVVEGLAQGYGYKKTAQLFKDRFEGTTNNLIRIVQTETHRAQELGNLAASDKAKSAAERLGLKLRRYWLATLDGRTRDAHGRLEDARPRSHATRA